MKKYFLFFFCCSFLFIIQNVIAEILPQPDVVDGGIIFLDSDDGLKGPVPNSSLTENINLINQLLEFIGLIFIIPGLIGLYLCPSLGAS